MNYHVYAIYCPISKEIKYIGTSNNVESRMRQHILTPHSRAIGDFMNSLRDADKHPVCKIIKSFFTQYEADVFEKQFIIEQTNAGAKLLNKRHVKQDKPILFLTDFED